MLCGKHKMTVVRQNSEEFYVPETSVANAIEHVLNVGQRTYTYQKTKIEDDQTYFETVITPNLWPLLLTTRMSISIEMISANATLVTVRTESQRMIHGDIFNCYRGYVRDLFHSLRDAIQNAT